MYKLRDGLIDWFFCDSNHALDWLETRHCSLRVNQYYHKSHEERAQERGDLTIEEFFAQILADQ